MAWTAAAATAAPGPTAVRPAPHQTSRRSALPAVAPGSSGAAACHPPPRTAPQRQRRAPAPAAAQASSQATVPAATPVAVGEVQAVLFDMDGVLTSTEEISRQAAVEVRSRVNCPCCRCRCCRCRSAARARASAHQRSSYILPAGLCGAVCGDRGPRRIHPLHWHRGGQLPGCALAGVRGVHCGASGCWPRRCGMEAR